MYFPMFLSLSGRTALLVGDGPLADNKARLLEKAGASVDRRAVAPVDLSPYALIIAVAEGEAAEILAARARAIRVPINIVDQPHLSDFSVPAVVERDPVTIAIASDGSAPVLARRIRTQIEALIPERLGALARLIGRFRQTAQTRLPDISDRRRFWDEVLDGPIANLALQGHEADAIAALTHALDTGASPQGSVQIVGAGPGDPELLTLKAARALGEADVILYDDLVGEGVLDRARRDAERIYVGKRAGEPGVGQDFIQALMIARAKAGQRVVRLKGGDPFIFGRGGEEVEALRAENIAYEVIPGITAALGAAAEVALPLTFRREASALTLLTAYRAPDADAIDWSSHTNPQTTLAIYMGRESAGAVARGLIEAGRDPATPAAVVARATRADSSFEIGRLDQLPRLVAQAGEGPSLLIVGAVVQRADVFTQEQRQAV
ncbi:siroheme synthase CysG [Lacibacterium aquatile]|uniref:Siroheme synthase CysG n=1 Tax=Lacibacterium aquatile TaxID=1168082 RepID=A0ABW5DMA3_9PROT